jgi:hypothetical protein
MTTLDDTAECCSVPFMLSVAFFYNVMLTVATLSDVILSVVAVPMH